MVYPWAANLRARATRLGIRLVAPERRFPSGMQVPGHKPNQEQKCFALLNFDKSGPSSTNTFKAVQTSIPPISVKSTPTHSRKASRTSKFGAFLPPRFLDFF